MLRTKLGHTGLGCAALVAVSAVALLAHPPAAHAQASRQSAAPATEEIIVTARKREESIMKTPVIVSAIGQKQIENLHIQAVSAITAASPNLQINNGFALSGTTVQFRGLGNCHLPGNSTGMHLVFVGAEGTPVAGTVLSIYVERDDGRLPIEDGRTYRLQPKVAAYAKDQMFVWRRAGNDFFLVTASAPAGAVALASVRAPPLDGTL